jgi:hypothetical protein
LQPPSGGVAEWVATVIWYAPVPTLLKLVMLLLNPQLWPGSANWSITVKLACARVVTAAPVAGSVTNTRMFALALLPGGAAPFAGDSLDDRCMICSCRARDPGGACQGQ